MGLDIEVDRTLCIGSGACARIAPGVFELDDDQVAVVVDPDAASRTAVVAAAESCPTLAIRISDGDRQII